MCQEKPTCRKVIVIGIVVLMLLISNAGCLNVEVGSENDGFKFKRVHLQTECANRSDWENDSCPIYIELRDS